MVKLRTAAIALAMTFAAGFSNAAVTEHEVTSVQSFEWWLKRTSEVPGLPSVSAEMYLGALARAFESTERFYFYLADTLNPSIWAQGNGYLVIHGGIVSQVKTQREFDFLVALEMAHDVLRHEPIDQKPVDIPVITPLFLGQGSAELFLADGFSTFVVSDPVLQRGREFSVQEEAQALKLVAQFFHRMGWDYAKTVRSLQVTLPEIARVPKSSTLPKIHKNLGFALKLPVPERNQNAREVQTPIALSESTFVSMREDLARSTQQKFPWMLNIVPFEGVLANRTLGIEAKIDEVDRIAKTLEPLSREEKQALAWVINRVHLDHAEYEKAFHGSEKAVADFPGNEPYLYQKAWATMFLNDPEESLLRCREDLANGWLQFDYIRKLLHIECMYMHGDLTEALQLAESYRYVHGKEIQGVFWRILIRERLRMPVSALLDETENTWGPRPAVRAVKLIDAGYRGDKNAVEQLSKVSNEDLYAAAELGMLDFARYWSRTQVGGSDNSSLNRAKRNWWQSRAPERVLPHSL